VKYFIALFYLTAAVIANGATNLVKDVTEPTSLKYQIIAERSHKTSLFTQGLFIKDGAFYESTGLYGKSSLVTYPVAEPASTWAKLSSGFTKKQTLPENYFAEGLALVDKKVYQLTWHEGVVFVYDHSTLAPLYTLAYKGEGWGLTSNGKQLIRSDGSDVLFFHDTEKFSLLKTLHVTLNQQPLNQLNELEYFDGFIWANVWHDNRILKINPDTGRVVGILDLSSTIEALKLKDSESVLNGIAYDFDKKAVWVTGKQWPKMFLLKIN
jgi:glutaminyl-peptide cyclotransferase